jgi:hypothetical protein
MPTNRRFGVEIEFCTNHDQETIARLLRASGLNVHAEGYNHCARPHWKIVTDGSVSCGFELVSPILSGPQGLDEVRGAAKALVAAGCSTDKSCGLHVHVDASNLSGASVVNVLRRHARWEPTIDQMVPSHRRNNSYATSVQGDAEAAESYLRSNPTAGAAIICGRFTERYRKLNVSAYVRHNTLEFRQHSGTIDGTKIANWIMFCVAFVNDSVVTVRTVQPDPVTVPATPAPGMTLGALVQERLGGVRNTYERVNARTRQYRKLVELFAQAAQMFNYVTGRDIAQALEIAEASVPSYVSMFRDAYPDLTICARRGRGYYCTNFYRVFPELAPSETPLPRHNVVQPQIVVDIPNDRGIFASLPLEVTAYFQERILDLS